MNDFRMDIMEYEKNHLAELKGIPMGVHTVLGYLQGKRCLDYLKKLCQGETEVLTKLVRNLKKDTNNFENMSSYATDLQLAIESVIGKSLEVGAASFFSADTISLDSEGVTSQSDFDIVAFVIVKRE